MDTRGKPVFLDPQGKPIPRDEHGVLTAPGHSQKFEVIESDSTDDPLTDEAGNVVEAGTEEALLRKVKAHFAEAEDTQVISVTVRKTEDIKEVSGADLAAVK
jgi:hypothetical protein